MIFFDPTYMIFMLPAILLMIIAQGYVSGAYRKWSQVIARSRLTGAQAAQRLISAGGLGVSINGVSGKLTDNYDPRRKVLNLSEGVYNSSSVAALAITAHELGHAMQDRDGYFPLKLKSRPGTCSQYWIISWMDFNFPWDDSSANKPGMVRSARVFRWRNLRVGHITGRI